MTVATTADTASNNTTKMDRVVNAKTLDDSGIDAASTSSDTDLSSGSDSEDSFPTGLRQRRGGNTASDGTRGPEEVFNDPNDPNARVDINRSKYNRTVKKTSKNTVTTTSEEGQPYTLARWLEFFAGCCIFFIPLPLVFLQILQCNIWELADQATLKLADRATQLNEWCGRNIKFYKKPVMHPKDTFMVNATVWLGVCLPGYWLYHAYIQAQSIAAGNGFLWKQAALYNIIRIGPQYRNFMYVYVLCHKEAHAYGKLFQAPYRNYGLGIVYNYYIGFFHGVIPGPFTEAHIYNHHKYDNDSKDIHSTGAYPRDSFKQYLRYVYVFFLYALNISSMAQFYAEGNTYRAMRCVGGCVHYLVGLTLTAKFVSPLFALMYVFYPLVEANILLSAVNYTWHAFIDPDDHDNDYVNSTTVLDALNFTLDEEYHVVHHQYGGVHWSRNKELYEKHIDEYKKCTATVFRGTNIFVIWGMIVAKDYDGLVDYFVQYEEDPDKQLSRQELVDLLKARLRCTTWTY